MFWSFSNHNFQYLLSDSKISVLKVIIITLVLAWSSCATQIKAPLWVFECVCSRQISPEIVSQQHHLLQSHPLPPFLQGCQELLLSRLRVGAEQRATASAKAQQVQRIDRPTVGQRVQVLGPESNTAPKAMQQDQRRSSWCWGLRRREWLWQSWKS